jgi:hypothetical protein
MGSFQDCFGQTLNETGIISVIFKRNNSPFNQQNTAQQKKMTRKCKKSAKIIIFADFAFIK